MQSRPGVVVRADDEQWRRRPVRLGQHAVCAVPQTDPLSHAALSVEILSTAVGLHSITLFLCCRSTVGITPRFV